MNGKKLYNFYFVLSHPTGEMTCLFVFCDQPELFCLLHNYPDYMILLQSNNTVSVKPFPHWIGSFMLPPGLDWCTPVQWYRVNEYHCKFALVMSTNQIHRRRLVSEFTLQMIALLYSGTGMKLEVEASFVVNCNGHLLSKCKNNKCDVLETRFIWHWVHIIRITCNS